MMSFTPQEMRILTFLIAALIIGSALSLYRHRKALIPLEIIHGSEGEPQVAEMNDSTSVGSEAVGDGEKVDINVATEAQLQSLPGIGPSLARRIIDYRQVHGPFSSPDGITQVRGIGTKTYQRFCHLITTGPSRGGRENEP